MLDLSFEFTVKESKILSIKIFDSSSYNLSINGPNTLKKTIEDYLSLYLNGKSGSLPIDKSFSPFSLKVYDFISKSLPGNIYTYKEVAEAIGCPKGYRAVGNSLNKNPFPLLIPCHRVVSTKDLGGFAYGKRVKEKLLAFEKDLSLIRT